MAEERLNKIARIWVRFTRWAIAPFCLGLLAALLILLVEFFRELTHLIAEFPQMNRSNVILAVLKLIDLVFVANLVLMVSNAGFERLYSVPRIWNTAHPMKVLSISVWSN